MIETWATDDQLAQAAARFTQRIPGFVLPVAASVARFDDDNITFGHVNKIGTVRPLAIVALASVCGYVDHSVAAPISGAQLAEVIDLLAPAEAATHLPHPNLWSWRALLAEASPRSSFVAYFLANASDQLQGPGSAEFLAQV